VDGTLAARHGSSQRVSGPPTMMFTATAPVPSLHRAQTLEPKAPGDLVYVLGATANELGASALYNLLGYVGLNAPRTDCKATLAACAAVSRALELGITSRDESAILDATAHHLKFIGFQQMYFENSFPPEMEVVPRQELVNLPQEAAPLPPDQTPQPGKPLAGAAFQRFVEATGLDIAQRLGLEKR
jgi:hypothetical protein